MIFVRHGQSTANAGGITMAHADIPLSPFGRLQAKAVADELATRLIVQPTAVLVSSMVRTWQTAGPLCARYGLTPVVHPELDEFSVIDPVLIAGLKGEQRKHFVKAYWDEAVPHRRLGDQADTFAEFEDRVWRFLVGLPAVPDGAVVFGHGIWFAMLVWQILGYRAIDASGMRAFRRFQQSLPIPNCAVFSLANFGDDRWSVKAETAMEDRIATILSSAAGQIGADSTTD